MKEIKHTDILIIGGGILGCSIAYHLSLSSKKKIVVLEKSGITHGATWHAAGLVGQLRSSRNTTRMLRNSVALYQKLQNEMGLPCDWKQVGSLRLSCSVERDRENKRLMSMAKSFGLEMDWLSAKEAQTLFPLMSLEQVRSAIFVPTDGYIDPSSVCRALASAAKMNGVEIIEQERVLDFSITNKRITEVHAEKNTWTCETVVNASGMWAYELGKLAGVKIPAFALEHQFVVTEPIPNIPKNLPTLRDPDHLVYYKQEIDSLAIGGYEDNTLPYAKKGIPYHFGQELLKENFERFEPLASHAIKRTPVVGTIGVRKLINGPIPYSADGDFVMGKVQDLENLYVSSGFLYGIAAGGGAGQAMAEWILEGSPSMNLWPLDIRRFSFHHSTQFFMYPRAVEIYGKHYKLKFPQDEHKTVRAIRRSPLYSILKNQGAVYGSRCGWERPNWFCLEKIGQEDRLSFERSETNFFHAVEREHKTVREKVALIDQSSFSKFELVGRDALSILQYLACSDLNKPIGSTHYTQLCNERGGVEADVTISRIGENRFYLVTGSAFGNHDRHWIESHIPTNANCHLVDLTSARSVINLCGPFARKVLEKSTEEEVENSVFPFSSCRFITIGAAPVLAIRIGYVGELGWELHIPTEYTEHVYEVLWQAGQEFEIQNVGYRAIESLRLEKRYLYWSTDLTPDYTPLEAGLGFRVHFQKENFLGRAALVKQKEKGVQKKLCTFVLEKPLSLYGSEAVLFQGKVVGTTTSGGYGFTIKKSIAFSYLPTEITNETEGYEIEAFGEKSQASLLHMVSPYHTGVSYDPKNERLKS